jgi:hypothetical protein
MKKIKIKPWKASIEYSNKHLLKSKNDVCHIASVASVNKIHRELNITQKDRKAALNIIEC